MCWNCPNGEISQSNETQTMSGCLQETDKASTKLFRHEIIKWILYHLHLLLIEFRIQSGLLGDFEKQNTEIFKVKLFYIN